jgi:hypothetical protein
MRNRKPQLPICFGRRVRTVNRQACISTPKISRDTRALLTAVDAWNPKKLPQLRGVNWRLVFAAATALISEFPKHSCLEVHQPFSCAQHAQHAAVVVDAARKTQAVLQRRRAASSTVCA